jgi:hypothetical protein
MKSTTMKIKCSVAFGLFLLAGGLLAGSAQAPATSSAQPPTTIDAALGSCSLDVTVTTADGKPAAAASVTVHIAYGFGGFHKLDLEAGANLDGKVKFMGLPSRVRRPPLQFRVFTKDQGTGEAAYDPAAECHSHREITLAKPSS